jgi:S-adenosylmethionine/arginine decarboxylase-like enzyme
MVPFGEPQIVMFGSGNKKGYTLVQLIETSNITAHFVEETDDLYLDVFSCKEFEEKDVIQMIDYHLLVRHHYHQLYDDEYRFVDHLRLDLQTCHRDH